MKVKFFEIKNWEADYFKSKLEKHQLFFSPKPLNSSNLPTEKDFDSISVFTDSKIDSTVINHFPNLKLITTRTTGTDHIDKETAKTKNISVKNVPTYGENTVAEFTFALLLSLSRKIIDSSLRVKNKGNFTSDGLQGFDLAGKKIGVIGTGHIGQHVIKIANGFGMKVIGFDAVLDQALENQLNFQYHDFNYLLQNSDVITLHVPYLPTTHHLINVNNINLIKKGSILINTARGSIVETAAIVKALNEGILSGVGLDVLEEETELKNVRQLILEGNLDDEDLKTLLSNHILIDMDNVIITPHNAYDTKEALIRILNTTIENIQALE